MAQERDRRLGTRREAIWLRLTWNVTRPARWGRRRTEEEGFAVLDISVSGLRAAARTAPDVAVGTTVTMHLDEHEVAAIVRRIERDDDRGESVYGLQFLDPPAAFIDALFLQAGEKSVSSAEEFWRRAR
jgi:hypothetical protein